jgi:hypothetical protein
VVPSKLSATRSEDGSAARLAKEALEPPPAEKMDAAPLRTPLSSDPQWPQGWAQPVFMSEREHWEHVKHTQRSTVAAQMLLNPAADSVSAFQLSWGWEAKAREESGRPARGNWAPCSHAGRGFRHGTTVHVACERGLLTTFVWTAYLEILSAPGRFKTSGN